jgi:peptidoglycan/LPS O-acetylase OafA/YrhL
VSNRGGPFPNLDAYRGIGMILVMTNHVAFSSGLFARHPTLNSFIARFDISIPVFFMVSGFLLFRPFVASLLDENRPVPSTRDFAANRALRILPAYWAALFGVFVWFGLPTIESPALFATPPLGPILYYASMLQTFSAKAVFQSFGAFDQAWSIGTEVTFYALLPVAAAGLRRFGEGRPRPVRIASVVGLCIFCWAFAQLFRVWLVTVEPTWAPSALFWLPANVDFFAIGMLLALFSVRERAGEGLPVPLGWLSTRPWAAWTLAALLWLVVVNPTNLWSLFEIRPNPLELSSEYVAKQFTYGFVGILYLLPATFGPQRAGMIRALLGSRPLAALGTISLGFYLWHKAWLLQAEEWTGAQPFRGSFPRLWLITLVGGLLSGVLSYWLVERPALSRKRRRAAPAPVPQTVR